MPAAAPSPTTRPPGRALLRVAGALTQLSCGACLLFGTIGFVLVQQSTAGSLGSVVVWLAGAMAGLVFGGLIYRGGLVNLLVAAAIDAGFGIGLIAIEYDTLRRLLKILPASDVAMIGDALDGMGLVAIGAAAICVIALPQGIRYARWFRDAAATRSAMSTARGFPPPPVPARTAAYVIPSEVEPASRRRLYLALGGLAIGVGVGVGVLVSSSKPSATPGRSSVAQSSTGPGTVRGASAGSVTPSAQPVAAAQPRAASEPRLEAGAPGVGADAVTVKRAERAGSAGSAGSAEPTTAPAPPALPAPPIEQLLAVRRAALAAADPRALAELISPSAFGFGVDADEVTEGRDLVVAQIVRDLGDPPAGGFTIESRARSVGQERGHAWIAEEIEVSSRGTDRRRFAITELAAVIDGAWKIVALHWATPVDDATAERLAILKTLPAPQPVPDRHDGSDALDRAVRAAFASRSAFADARSERSDAFNYGSGGERASGGTAIKRIFTKLKAQVRIHDGARVVAGSAWDPAQKAAPWIGWAALNVDFTSKTRAATDITQTFRVLAIFVVEGSEWKIVQTQWSNAGPIR